MKKQGRRQISAMLVVIMVLSIILQTNLAASADEVADIYTREQIIGLDEGLPTYRETVEDGAEAMLPETVRVIVALSEKDESAEEDVFVPAVPPVETEQEGYELVEGTNDLYQWYYDEETDVTQEVENGCAYLENGTYVAYRCYGSLNGAAAAWYACDSEGALRGEIRDISVTWEDDGLFDAEVTGIYTYTADADSFSEYDLLVDLPAAEIMVAEGKNEDEGQIEAESGEAEPEVYEPENTELESAEQPLAEEISEPAAGDVVETDQLEVDIIPLSAERADIYWNPSTSDVVDLMTGNTVGNGGNDNNSGRTAMSPLLTWAAVKAEAAAHSNFVNIIIMTQVNVTDDPATTQIDSVVNGGGAMKFSQWSYHAGIVFVIQPEASLELKNLTVDCSQTVGGVAIFLADNNTTSVSPVMGTFTIGEGLYIVDGMIQLDMDKDMPGKITAPPIVLATANPAGQYVLYLSNMTGNAVFNDYDIIDTPGPDGRDYLDCFSLDSRNADEDWLLVQSSNVTSNIMIRKTIEWEGVFIDGRNGNDSNFGGNCRAPVKTFDRAKQIMAEQVALGYEWNIYICDTVDVTGTEIWELPGGGIYGSDPKVLPCFNHLPRTMIDVKNGGNLTLQDITICHDRVTGGSIADYRILHLSKGSTCVVKDGTVLSGEVAAGQANTTAAGIVFDTNRYNDGGGTINLTISGGRIEWLRYGVYANTSWRGTCNDTINMTGGKIANCVDAGVYLYYSSATNTNNGGSLHRVINLNMNGGEVTGNQGRGIYSYEVALAMTLAGNSSITDNMNGGIYMHAPSNYSPNLMMTAGKVTDNSSSTYGGGIYWYGGVVTISGGEIIGNTGTARGGGVYCTTLNFSGGAVSDNTVQGGSAAGGGIYGSNITMTSAAVVDNNQALATGVASGGGIYSGNYLILNGGTNTLIADNVASGASSYGGGVDVGYLRMDGGTIRDNTADSGTQCHLRSTSSTNNDSTNELIGGTIKGSGSDFSTIYFSATTTAAYGTRAWIGFDPVNMDLTGNFYFNSTYEYIRLYDDIPIGDQVAGRWVINLNVTPEVFDIGSILVRSSGSASVKVGSNTYAMTGAAASQMDSYLACFAGGTLPDTPNKTIMGMFENMVILLGEGVYLDGTDGHDGNTGDSPATAVRTWEQAVMVLKSKIAAAEADGSDMDGMSPYIYVSGKVVLAGSTDQTLELDYDDPQLTPSKNSKQAELRRFTPYTGVLFEVSTPSASSHGNVTFGKMFFNGLIKHATDNGNYDISVAEGTGTGDADKAELYLTDEFYMETMRAVSVGAGMRMVMQGNANILARSPGTRIYAASNSSITIMDDSVIDGGGTNASTAAGAIISASSATVSLQDKAILKGGATGLAASGSSTVTMSGQSACSNNRYGITATGNSTVVMSENSACNNNYYTGLTADSTSVVTLSDQSTCSNNEGGGTSYSGISASGSSMVTLSDQSACSNNRGNGISVSGSSTVTLSDQSTCSNNAAGIHASGSGIVNMQDDSRLLQNTDGILISGGAAMVSMFGNSNITGGSRAFNIGTVSGSSSLMTPMIGMYENSAVSGVDNGLTGTVSSWLYTRVIFMMGRNGVLTDTPTLQAANQAISTNTYGKVVLQGAASVSTSSSTLEKIVCDTLEMYDSARVYHSDSGMAVTSIATVNFLYMQDDAVMEIDAPNAYPASGPLGVVNIKRGGELSGNALIENNSVSYSTNRELAGIYYQSTNDSDTLILADNAEVRGAAGSGIIIGTGYRGATLVMKGNASITGSGTYGIYDNASYSGKSGKIILDDNASITSNNTSGTVEKGASIYVNSYGSLQIAGTSTVDDEIYLADLAKPISLSSVVNPAGKSFSIGCDVKFQGSRLVIPVETLTDAAPYLANFIESPNFPDGLILETRSGDENIWVSSLSVGDVYLAGDATAGAGTVSPGDDANDGLSIGTPVRTFERAKEILKTMPMGTNIIISSQVNIIPDGVTVTWAFDPGGYFTNHAGQTWKPLVQRHENLQDLLITACYGDGSNYTLEFKDITIDGNGELVTDAAPLISCALGNVELVIGENAVLQNNSREEDGGVTWGSGGAAHNSPGYDGGRVNWYSAVVTAGIGSFRMEGGTIRDMNNYGAVYTRMTPTYFNSGRICENTNDSDLVVIAPTGGVMTVTETHFRDIEIYSNTILSGSLVNINNNRNGATYIEGNGSIHDNLIDSTTGSTTGTIMRLETSRGKLGGNFQITNNTIQASVSTGSASVKGQIMYLGNSETDPIYLTENFAIQGNRIVAESDDDLAEANGKIITYYNTGAATLEMDGGLIADNVIEADNVEHSGGIYAERGSMNLNDGVIRGNKCIGAGSKGAGVLIDSYQGADRKSGPENYYLTIRGTSIIDNEADEGAGIYMGWGDATRGDPYYDPDYDEGNHDKRLEIYYGTISNNKPAGVSGISQDAASGVYIGGTNFRLRGSGSIIEDHIYLASNEDDTRITLSGVIYHATRIYNVDVGPDFNLGDIVVRPDGDMVLDATSYLRNFNISNDAFVLEKASPNLVLMKYMFIDSISGDDSNSGIDPLNAKRTWAGATEYNDGEGLALYISGPVHVSGTEYWTLPWNSLVSRYTGFAVSGVSFPAYEGHLVELESGDNLTVDSVLIRGRRDQDTGFNGGKAMFYVGSGASLILTENAQLMNNLNNQDGRGGAVYNHGGSTYIDGARLTGMAATDGADVYQAGWLTLAGTPQMSGEVYLAGSAETDSASHKIDVEDSFSMGLGQKIRINIENPFDTRHVVEYLSGHIPTEVEQDYFELHSGISAVYMIHERTGAEHILELWLKNVVYIDGINGNNSNDGTAPLKAVKTFHEAYQRLSSSNKGGVLMVVGTVTISGGGVMTMKNTASQGIYFEGPESSPSNMVTVTGEVSIRRYVQPTAWSTLSAPLDPADFNKASNQNALIRVDSSAELSLSRMYIDGGNQALDGYDQYAGPAVSSGEAMLILDGGSLNATSSVLYRNTNDSVNGTGGGIYIPFSLSYATCRLSDVTMEDNYVTGEGSKGSAVYYDGDAAMSAFVLDRSVSIDGEIHLTGSGTAAASRFITIQRSGFMQISDGNYLNVTLEDRYLGRKVVQYPSNYVPTAADDIPIYILEADVQESFTLGNRSGDGTVLELQAPRRVYIDGIHGNDANIGDVPVRSVETLRRAYELLEESGGGRLYVVNTVSIAEYISLTDHHYADETNAYTITGGLVEIRRYIVPDAYQSDSEYKNAGASVGDHTGTLFEVTGSGELHLANLIISGEKNARDGSDIFGPGGNPQEDYTGTREVQAASIEVKNGGNLMLGANSELIDNNNVSPAKYGGAIENYGYVDLVSGKVSGNEAVKGAGIYQGGTFNIVTGAEGLASQEIYLVTDYIDRIIRLSEHIHLGSGAWNSLEVNMDNAVDGRNVTAYDFNAVLANEIDGYSIPAATLGYNLFLGEADSVTEPNTLELYRPEVSVSFTKVAAENTSQPLAGAKFKVYENTCTNPAHNHSTASTQVNDVVDSASIADGCWTPQQTGGIDTVYTSAAGTGLVDIGTLKQGLYMLVEIETAPGYQLPTGQWMLYPNGVAGDSGPGDYILNFTAKTYTNLPPAVIRDLSGNSVSYKVVNAKALRLPLTGGMPRMLVILGVVIMTASLGCYYYRNRKMRRKNVI